MSNKTLVVLISIVGIAAASLLVLILSSAGHSTSGYGIRPVPSFIEELQSGRIRTGDVAQFAILHFNPGWGWPFQESEYAKLDRVDFTGPADIDELLSILNTNSIPGTKQRNHPGTISYGIFRIDLRSGEHFYLYYEVQNDWQSGKFASINANSADSTNPNGAEAYESTAIIDFLRRKDPWFDNKAIVQPAPPGYD